ncbi:hypothetical protein TNIN_129971 [Trichonephila inaurata madagascariensis]|uniref:Uncharacterized protein n=1 Tax=Trichonephila inaurata madagascariensis TaxID=2747483 RepID=A0A8X7BS34_9ARAC|nr:hypothetical protein TNIN_129971 [Trichonephila inaurata madagascariensis]
MACIPIANPDEKLSLLDGRRRIVFSQRKRDKNVEDLKKINRWEDGLAQMHDLIQEITSSFQLKHKRDVRTVRKKRRKCVIGVILVSMKSVLVHSTLHRNTKTSLTLFILSPMVFITVSCITNNIVDFDSVFGAYVPKKGRSVVCMPMHIET